MAGLSMLEVSLSDAVPPSSRHALLDISVYGA